MPVFLERNSMNIKVPILLIGTLLSIALSCSAAFEAPKAMDIAQKHACLNCHSIDQKIVGPAYKDVAAKYKGNAKAQEMLMAKVKKGSSGVWGSIAMPPSQIGDSDLKIVIQWILAGAPKK